MELVNAAVRSDFESTDHKTITLLGKRVAIFRERGGGFYALEVSCKHHGADLTTGVRDGDIVTCPRHGWRYNLVTGECVHGNSPPLRRHAVEVDGEHIRVSLYPV